MELYVKDIEKIWSSGGASLVAGKNGIMRKVESYDMMEQLPPDQPRVLRFGKMVSGTVKDEGMPAGACSFNYNRLCHPQR